MQKELSEFIPIGRAATYLGISIDTLRRWEKAGKIISKRLDGKNRYFKRTDLDNLKSGNTYDVAEAAKYLGISASTLRRRLDNDEITSVKDPHNYQRFKKEDLDSYLTREPIKPSGQPMQDHPDTQQITYTSKLSVFSNFAQVMKKGISLPAVFMATIISSVQKFPKLILSKYWKILLAIIILVAAFTPSFYFYRKYQSVQKISPDKNSLDLENKALVERLTEILDLPSDEIPSVAAVTDPEKLKDQLFFAKASKGDKVIIYPKAKKVILYNVATNKIMGFNQINLTENQVNATPNPSSTPSAQLDATLQKIPFTVVLYNGTNSSGLTFRLEQLLKENKVNARILDRDSARKKDYGKSQVIDLGTGKSYLGKQLAEILNADLLSEMPPGEIKPVATGSAAPVDFLIIAGQEAI